MEKSVYLRMDSRVKEVSFIVTQDANEWISLRRAMCCALQKDVDLSTRVENSRIIFQKSKLKKSGEKIVVDVDEECEKFIEDECELNVIFCPMVKENFQNTEENRVDAPENIQAKKNEILFDDMLSTIDAEIYECMNVNEKHNSSYSSKKTSSSGKMSSSKNISLSESEDDIQDHTQLDHLTKTRYCPSISTAHEKKVPKVNLSAPEIEYQEINTTDSTIETQKHLSTSKPKQQKRVAMHLHRPMIKQLPDLTHSLQQYVNDGQILIVTSKFYNFYAEVLREWTQDNANHVDYDIMAEAVCLRHPELLVPQQDPPWRCCRRFLSEYSRNQRQAEKRAKKKFEELENDKVHPNKRTKSISSIVLPNKTISKNNEQTERDIETLYTELNSTLHTGASTHVLYLIKTTYSHRRKWIIETQDPQDRNSKINEIDKPRVSTITQKFPHLKQPKLILYELALIHPMQDYETSLEKSLKDLSTFFKMPCDNDSHRCDILLEMNKRLRPARLNKKANNLIIVLPAMTPLKNELITNAYDAPRLVLYIDDDVLATAFVVADGCIEIQVEEPTVVKSLLCLSGLYHICHIGYPSAYKNVLALVDEILFEMKNFNPSGCYSNFLRDWINSKKGKI